MAKIFYCGGSSGRMGTLHAVLPLADFARVLSEESPDYVGRLFPEIKESTLACTLIEVKADEESEHWRAGFYRVEKRPLDFEDFLWPLGQAPTVPSEVWQPGLLRQPQAARLVGGTKLTARFILLRSTESRRVHDYGKLRRHRK
jgi:hypothetical protein